MLPSLDNSLGANAAYEGLLLIVAVAAAGNSRLRLMAASMERTTSYRSRLQRLFKHGVPPRMS
jgi:hypothetical protein